MTPTRLPRAFAPWAAAAFLMIGASFLTGPAATLSAQAVDAAPARSVADGVYSDEQAARGEGVFQRNCTACHTPTEFRGDAFLGRWATVGSLFELVSTTMPQDFPGGLRPEEYADVLAFFLRSNELPAGADDLPAEKPALDAIRMGPRR